MHPDSATFRVAANSSLVSASAVKLGCVDECRGCQHRDLDPQSSELQKENWIRSQLQEWDNLIEPILGVKGDARWGYRQKTCLHAEWDHNHWKFGLLRSKRVDDVWIDEVIHIPDCPVHSELIRKLGKALSCHLPGPETLPLVYLTVSGTLATLVIKSSQMPTLPKLDWETFGLTGLFVNLNPAAGKRVYSSRGWRLAWGQEFGQEGSLRYGVDSFQQLIPDLHQLALDTAVEFLNPTSQDFVVDFYSGIGRSLKVWKNLGVKFKGVELGGSAFACAEINAGPSSCYRGKVSDRLPQIEAWLHEEGLHREQGRNILAYVNPPRLGLEAKVVQWLGQVSGLTRIAYLSCSAGTLKRDLSVLVQNGFQVKRIIPYDFFPQTHHVETLVLLVRSESDSSSCFSHPSDSRLTFRPQ